MQLEKLSSAYDYFRYASDAYVCNIAIKDTSVNNCTGTGANIKVNRTMLTTSSSYATKSAYGIVKVGNGLNVSQGTISTAYQVWEGTQAEYEALPSHDNKTFYVIKNATA